MAKETVEVLSTNPHAPVLQRSGRSFPGLLIQGDSLKELARQARSIMDMVLTDPYDAIDEAEYMTSKLEHLVSEYEQALATHEIDLPYKQ